MKKLLLSSTLMLNFIFVSNASAFDYQDLLNKAKDAATKAVSDAKAAAHNANLPSLPAAIAPTPKLSSQNSQVTLNGTTPADTHWMMIRMNKEGETTVDQGIVVPVQNGQYTLVLYLKNGPGNYSINLFTNNSTEKYVNNYYALKTISAINLDQRDTSFLLPSQEVQVDDPEIVALSEELTKDAADQAAMIKNIHDYITANIKYDYDSYNDGSYVNKPYDAITVLHNQKSICSGYSDLFAALARAAGIRAKIINGKVNTGDHAWNEVFVDGEWRVVDTTWDAVAPNTYTYFFPTAEAFARDHQKVTERLDL